MQGTASRICALDFALPPKATNDSGILVCMFTRQGPMLDCDWYDKDGRQALAFSCMCGFGRRGKRTDRNYIFHVAGVLGTYSGPQGQTVDWKKSGCSVGHGN